MHSEIVIVSWFYVFVVVFVRANLQLNSEDANITAAFLPISAVLVFPKVSKTFVFSSARVRNPSAKRCKTLCGSGWEGKKKAVLQGNPVSVAHLRKNKTNLLRLMQNVAYEPLMLQPSALLLRATSDILSLPPHHLIGFTALPFSCTFFMYPTPCPTSETVIKHRKSKALV
ncbi:MAG: hypothetical protein MR517_05620 [Bacteroidales bacterium]|nr:hypothetical protein [Bacteroidales bacterium]